MLEEDAAWDPASYNPPAEEGKTRFKDFPIHKSVIHAIADLGFQYCTPIQAQLLELKKELQQEFNMAVLLITHDLTMVKKIADNVSIMHQGRITGQLDRKEATQERIMRSATNQERS